MVVLLSLLLAVTPELEEGRALSAALKYQAAIPKLTIASKDPSAPVAERREALDLLARAALAVGKTTLAEDAWAGLLELDPMAETPKGAPKVVASFDRAKRRRFAPDFVALERLARPAEFIEVRLINPWRLAVRVELLESTGGAFVARDLALEANQTALATLTPGSRFVVQVRRGEAVLASLGSQREPLAGPPQPAAPAPPTGASSATSTEPPPLPPARRPAETVADAPTATGPLDAVVNPRVVPLNEGLLAPATGSSVRRLAGWVLVTAGIVLMVAGLAYGGWGLWELDRSTRAEVGAAERMTLRESAEERLYIGGAGLAAGVLGTVIGGLLVGTSEPPPPEAMPR